MIEITNATIFASILMTWLLTTAMLFCILYELRKLNVEINTKEKVIENN